MKKITTIEEIQDIQFDMMMYVKQIAEKNHIKVMLSGGTLLGAVRHQGFIPWDDDVDLMLMRSDYEKLIKCIENDTQSRYRIMTIKNTKTYPFSFAKLVDTRTRVKFHKEMTIRHMGVAADIFPIDALPSDDAFRKKMMDVYGRLVYTVFDIRDTNYRCLEKGISYQIRTFGARICSRIIQVLGKSFSLKKATHVAVVMGQYKEKEIMKKEDMINQTEVIFRGDKFLAPRGYKRYLASLYGKNYMSLPPKAWQRPKHAINAYWI